jgi:hypothetical protein
MAWTSGSERCGCIGTARAVTRLSNLRGSHAGTTLGLVVAGGLEARALPSDRGARLDISRVAFLCELYAAAERLANDDDG